MNMIRRICISLNNAAPLVLLPCFYVFAGSPQVYFERAERAFDRSDIVSAIAHYRKAAEAGHLPAQKRLAYLLDKSEENKEAIKWYQMAAQQGDAEAEHGLAGMYASGESMEKNYSEALRLFRSSANKGYTPAIHVMASAYEEGEMGLRVDYEMAREWLKKGVQLNDYWSTERLARAYANGELGLRIDRKQATGLEQRLTILKKESE